MTKVLLPHKVPMKSILNPYINFNGEARQAAEFYHSVFGGKLDLTTFGEANMAQNPADNDRVMHAMLEAENGMTFMISDTSTAMGYEPGSNISLSLSGDNEAELRAFWDKLSAGGNITMPLDKAPWGDTFGMFTDKFGIQWMVNITAPKV